MVSRNLSATGVLLLLFHLAATAYAEEQTTEPAKAWPLETTVELAGHTRRARCLAFHPDGTVLASGGLDRTLRLWSVEKAEAIATCTLPRSG